MKNYEDSKQKIKKLISEQQEIENTKDSKNYTLESVIKSIDSKKVTIIESDWVECSITELYPDDDCFLFSFLFSNNLSITEEQLMNIEHAMLFKGKVISYKETIDGSVKYGIYNPNLTFIKLGDNRYMISITGTGIGEEGSNIFAKLLILIKNYRYNNTINKYE